MLDSNKTNNDAEPLREWTVMFYFASDNPLAPAIVSQLKAIKNAGYHPDVNVVAQFDPNTKDTPTHIFDVNRVDKLRHQGEPPDIGFRADNPYVRNMAFDKLWSNETDDSGQLIKAMLTDFLSKPSKGIRAINFHAPEPEPALPPAAKSPVNQESRNGDQASRNTRSSEVAPKDSLQAFLRFCARKYPAKHYMLFILGHGLVVGNDIFLFDADAPNQSLSLRALRVLLQEFKDLIALQELDRPAELELIGFHSCSMSSLEVAYELNGIANYMLASQGPAFVNSWPYREILIRVFKGQVSYPLNPASAIAATIRDIFDYITYNSYDFQLAGYSFDLALCDLKADLSSLTTALNELCDTLKKGLTSKYSLPWQLIITAHWEAQSYWQESYIDLYDFCSCLIRAAEKMLPASKEPTGIASAPKMLAVPNAPAGILSAVETLPVSSESIKILDLLKTKAKNVQLALKDAKTAPLILDAKFAGPEYQYSRGLSVYFPWSEPDNQKFWTTEYPEYKINMPRNEVSWISFLTEYFKATMRDPIGVESHDLNGNGTLRKPPIEEKLLDAITSKIFNKRGKLSHSSGTLDDPTDPNDKPGGGSVTGMDCGCPGIKNYPSFTRPGPSEEPNGYNATNLDANKMTS